MRHAFLLLALAMAIVSASPARADMVPPPTRPNWDDPPAPLPEPPADDARRWLTAAALLAATGAALYRTRRPVRSVA